MKKLVKICLFLLILNFNINVYATKEIPDESVVKEEEIDKKDNDDEQLNKEDDNQDIDDSKSNDTTLKDVYINKQNDYKLGELKSYWEERLTPKRKVPKTLQL